MQETEKKYGSIPDIVCTGESLLLATAMRVGIWYGVWYCKCVHTRGTDMHIVSGMDLGLWLLIW